MSGYSYGGNPPQYPPPQNQVYPQLYNPANAPPPGHQVYPQLYNPANAPSPGHQAAMSYPTAPGQNPQYPYQPGFPSYGSNQGMQGHPPPAAMGYGIAPTPTIQLHGFRYESPGGVPQPYTPVEWVPTTPQAAHTLSDRAVVAGYEGYDQSPLWIIRANFQGDLIPGKLAVKHRSAYIAWGGAENAVQNIEVCCVRPELVRWVESSDGNVPANAILGGKTAAGEILYIARAKEQGSLTPGKVHPSHKAAYISFGGKEVAHKKYEVLCSV